jgi:hypothetical protein
MTPSKFPHTVDELFDALDRLVPERVPEAGDSMEAIQRYAGKRELVLYLHHWRGQRERAERRAVTKGRR